MKKLLSIVMVLLFVFSLAACTQSAPQQSSAPKSSAAPQSSVAPQSTPAQSSAPASSDPYASLKPIELKFANGAAIGAAGDLWALEFKKAVEKSTNGKIKINYFPNSQLGVDSETQQQMLAGDIDIVACQPAQTTSFVPGVSVFDLPLVFAQYDAKTIDKALNNSSFTQAINNEYAKKNMINLGYLQGATFREMTSNKEIKTVDDFKGVKIRTMENKFHVAFWKALGATPTPLAFTELYISLQQGVVDAQENANDTNVSAKFNEVQKFLVNTHHILYLNQFLMNKKKFEALDPVYQKAIREAVATATGVIAPQMEKINSDKKAELLSKGMKSLEFQPAFYDEIIKRAQSVYNDVRSAVGNELVDTLLKELKAASGK